MVVEDFGGLWLEMSRQRRLANMLKFDLTEHFKKIIEPNLTILINQN